MLVDPDLAALVPLLPVLDLDDVAATRGMLASFAAGDGDAARQPWQERVAVSNVQIPGPPGAPEVSVRVYHPHGRGIRPALVYFHGGAFVLGEIRLFDTMCADYAASTDIVVVSVDYRLAPEHPFPAAVDDAYAALEWTAGGGELHVDAAAVAVGGASAGGGLAAAITLMARDRDGPAIAFQLLLYPVLDDRLETPSVRGFTDTPLWTSLNVAAMWNLYLGAKRGQVSPYAAPARATDLSGLPPAYVLTCELDPLRDEGIAYAQRMLQAGVSVELHNVAGAFHGFDAFPVPVSSDAVAEQHAALRRALHKS